MQPRLILGACAVALCCCAAQAADLPVPTDAQMLRAVNALTAQDAEAHEAALGLIKGPSSDTYFGWLRDTHPAMSLLGHALERDGRVTQLDWAAESEDVLAQFEAVFRTAGLEWPEGMSASMTGWIAQDATQRGDVVGLAYLLLKRLADQQGHVILNLNADSDAYHFFLAPTQAARAWTPVALGNNTYIEQPDWQFADLMARIGVEPPVHSNHPVNRARTAPEAE